jgi:hypothetical protein
VTSRPVMAFTPPPSNQRRAIWAGLPGLPRMSAVTISTDLPVVLASWSWTAIQMATTPESANLEGKAAHLAYAADVVYALLSGCGLVRKSAKPYQTGSRR